MTTIPPNQIHLWVEKTRKAQGLSVTDASQAAGCSHQHWYNVESGVTVPKLGLLRRIAKAFGGKIVILFKEDNDEV